MIDAEMALCLRTLDDTAAAIAADLIALKGDLSHGSVGVLGRNLDEIIHRQRSFQQALWATFADLKKEGHS